MNVPIMINFLKSRLSITLRGEIPLGRVFWLYGILVLSIIYTNLKVSESYIHNAEQIYAVLVSLISLLIILLYVPIILISIWKSARNYSKNSEGPFLYALIASIWVGCSWPGFIIALPNIFSRLNTIIKYLLT